MAHSSFIEQTLIDINHTLEQSVFAERIARQPGLLQHFDPRGKLISMAAILIAIGSSTKLWIIGLLFAFGLIIAYLSKISLVAFIKRVCLLVLVFTSLIALPSMFMTPGPTLWKLGEGLVITRTGATSAVFLILRATTSISMATLFILTTRWNDVLKALGKLHLPDVIVLILAMTYRYIHLLLREAGNMFTARQSRLLRRLTPAEEHKLLGATGGVLLSKSLKMSEEVYLAMQSRGYHHYPRTPNHFYLNWQDICLMGFALTLMSTIIFLG